MENNFHLDSLSLQIEDYSSVSASVPENTRREANIQIGRLTINWASFEYTLSGLLSLQINSHTHATSIIINKLKARDRIRSMQTIANLIPETHERKAEMEASKRVMKEADLIREYRNAIVHNHWSGIGKGAETETLYFTPYKFLSLGSNPEKEFFYKIKLETIEKIANRLATINQNTLDGIQQEMQKS